MGCAPPGAFQSHEAYRIRGLIARGVPANCFSFQAEDGIRDLIVTGVQTCAFSIQAEDGIRDLIVTGVQTCALPICRKLESGGRWRCRPSTVFSVSEPGSPTPDAQASAAARQLATAERVRPGGGVRRQIGRASCRERV